MYAHAYICVCMKVHVLHGTTINSDVSLCLSLCLRDCLLFPIKYPRKLALQLLGSQLVLTPFLLPYGPQNYRCLIQLGLCGLWATKLRSSARQLIFLLSYLPCLETFNPHLNTGSWSTTALRVKPQMTSASIPSHS